MEQQPSASPIGAILNQFKLQSRLFLNAVESISDTDAIRQMNTYTNHVAWLTGHIVSSRFFLVRHLGLNVTEPFPELFANRKGLQKDAKYPSQSDLIRDWDSISELLITTLGNMKIEKLSEKIDFAVPTGNTLEALISFISHHEAYTIGQIGLYRRYMGYEGMKYS